MAETLDGAGADAAGAEAAGVVVEGTYDEEVIIIG